MPAKMILPNFSATMETAEIGKWLRKTGDAVAAGEAIVEIETDKTMLEIEAAASGILGEILVAEGETAAVGDVLVYIFDEGEDQCVSEPDLDKPLGAQTEPIKTPDDERERKDAETVQVGFARASPAARRLAREHNIDIAELSGTGPGGRVVKEDVIKAAGKLPSAPNTNDQTLMTDSANNNIRRRIAAQVCESRRTIPSFNLERWVGLGQLDVGERKILGNGIKVTITDYLILGVNAVLGDHPLLSHVWDQEHGKAQRLENPGIGLVVGLENGLIIPVLQGLKGQSLESVATLRHEAVSMARGNRLGNKFIGKVAVTISNLSRGGVDRFEAIINPGESAILAIGRMHDRVVAKDGKIVISCGCFITLSVDHRVIDGMVGASFLGDFVEHLECMVD